MPYIQDKEVLKAVHYARSLKGMSIQKAMFKAAKYYKVNFLEVAKHIDKEKI